jgi:acylphosphatase
VSPMREAGGPGSAGSGPSGAGVPPQRRVPEQAVAESTESAEVPSAGAARVRLTAQVDGWVQGVGFRWWVRARALELGLAGSATNLRDGRVEVVAEGTRQACRELLDLLRGPGTPGQVAGVTEWWADAPQEGLSGFVAK